MKVLTVRQPWAWAIAAGHKDVENRTWKNDALLGERIAIHAAATKVSREAFDYVRDMVGHQRAPAVADLQFGRVIATAKVEAFIHIDDDPGLSVMQACAGSPWFQGPWGWVLGEVERVQHAGILKGQLGLWNLPLNVMLSRVG